MEWQVRRGRDRYLVLGMVGALMVVQGSSAVAQEPNLALTVRPHEMATATRTAMAGKQTLDGKPVPLGAPGIDRSSGVYVPPQCVGTRRCPLVIIVNTPESNHIQVAEKYGMIIAHLAGANDITMGALFSKELEQILRTFAIDPDKIAFMSSCCVTGQAHEARYAAPNLPVFSLVVSGTQEFGGVPAPKAPKQQAEYLLATGLWDLARANFWKMQRLRDLGYPVTLNFQFRGHSHEYESYDFIGRWLQQAWAIPNPAARPVPYTFGDPPLLTEEILAKMTVFWDRFMQEPDSIKVTARRALLREVLLPVGKERISSWMVDMPALAAQYPSVAADLKAAGLTAQEHEVYRAALVSARVYQFAFSDAFQNEPGVSADSVSAFLGVKPTSALEKNFAFMSKHQPSDVKFRRVPPRSLEDTGMWLTP